MPEKKKLSVRISAVDSMHNLGGNAIFPFCYCVGTSCYRDHADAARDENEGWPDRISTMY